MAYRHSLLILICTLSSTLALASQDRGFADDKQGSNLALLVAVGHGLSGLDYDQNNIEHIVTNPEYRFQVTRLEEAQGTVANISAELTRHAREVQDNGTMLFYFTGHGAEGLIWPQDKTM